MRATTCKEHGSHDKPLEQKEGGGLEGIDEVVERRFAGTVAARRAAIDSEAAEKRRAYAAAQVPRGVACREGGRLALLCRLTTCLSGHCDTLTLSVCRVGPSACLASAACGAPRALGAWMGARCPASLPLPIALVTVSAGRGIHLP